VRQPYGNSRSQTFRRINLDVSSGAPDNLAGNGKSQTCAISNSPCGKKRLEYTFQVICRNAATVVGNDYDKFSSFTKAGDAHLQTFGTRLEGILDNIEEGLGEQTGIAGK
jgi:hypothetical protein